MHEVLVFCYLGAGMLAFIFSGVFIKFMAYFCNRINGQGQATTAGVVVAEPAATGGGGYRETVRQTSSSRVEVVVEKAISEGNEMKESLNNCTICISEIGDGELCWELTACNHTFHADCIQKWLKKNKTCPLCRTIIIVHAL